MTVTLIPHSGAVEVSAIIDGRRVAKVYYDYTVDEAVALFEGEYGIEEDS